MANKLKVGGVDVSVSGSGFSNRVSKAKSNDLLVSTGVNTHDDKHKLELSSSVAGRYIAGKPYPGFRMDYATAREIGRASTVINSIIKLRIQQVSMLPIKIIPAKKEPTRQVSILKYNPHDLDNHPAFDDSDRTFLRDIYERIDPAGTTTDKRKLYTEKKEEVLTKGDIATVDYLQDKHDNFYKKRISDIEKIEKLLKSPDTRNTMTKSWNSLIAKIGEDLILLDRAVLIKVRDTSGIIRHLMPVDGAYILPVVDEYGYNKDYPYVQVSQKGQHVYLKGEDVIVMMMNPLTDNRFFGYGLSPMETLYNVVLSDIFIDKGNLDYYRKGGSIPEGFISVEPPATKEGQIGILDQENLDSIQRQLQAIIMGDYTQIPIVSGGKFTWTDFKGKRRDMQFKELADYVVRKMCAVLQVSPQDVGILDGIKSSDGEVQANMTRNKGLMTIMSTISEFITQEVISEFRPESDLKLWFEEDGQNKADKNWGTQAKLQAGYFSINEARQEEGRPPHAWGDTPLQGLSKNWQPPNAESGGIPGMGVPMPTLPGGAPPMAPPPAVGGMPPMQLKSYNQTVFDAWDKSVSYDVSPLLDTYLKSSRFSEDDSLEKIRNYRPSAAPLEEYVSLANRFSVPVEKSSSDPDDILQIGLLGDSPFLSSLAEKIVEQDTDFSREVRKSYGDNSAEVVEYTLLSMLESDITKERLEETMYRYKHRNTSDYDVENVKNLARV